jgi:alanine racemase
MGRIGIWESEVLEQAREIAAIPKLAVAGIASHLPVADEDEEFTTQQLARFYELVASLRAVGLRNSIVHVENSAGIIGFSAQAGDLVRAGLALYGSSPIPAFQRELRPVLTWMTRVTLVRDVGPGRGISYGRTFITSRPTRIATLAVGYADGFQRHLSNCGAEVLIQGRRCAVLGRVTMDQILVDVTGLNGVEAGTESVIIGKQGDEEILAEELARKSGTIPWEIFTGIGNRVVRVEMDSPIAGV